MQLKTTKSEPSFGSFEIGPLSPGYGQTIGNALRRVLLSSLGGAAITSLRIDGVAHEFSTIAGVKQDVVDIILNLKQVRFQIEGEEPLVAVLDIKGGKKVVASDFKCPTGLSVVNKDAFIAELLPNGKLLLEVTVEKGVGYQPIESRKDEKLPIGVIAVDAAFSPIEKVNFTLENTRVGNMTNFDKLFLEITTDGSITPVAALQEAAEILENHFKVLKEFVGKTEMQPKVSSVKAGKATTKTSTTVNKSAKSEA